MANESANDIVSNVSNVSMTIISYMKANQSAPKYSGWPKSSFKPKCDEKPMSMAYCQCQYKFHSDDYSSDLFQCVNIQCNR